MAPYQISLLPLALARIHDLLFVPNTHWCSPFRKSVSIYLIVCKPTKQHSQTLDPIPGRHVERTWGSVNPTVARLVVNESLENSECNIPTDLQHAANRTPSIRDLDDLGSKGKEKAIPRDQTEDVTRKGTRTSTRTQLIEGLWELLRGSRDKNGHGYPHSSPQYGAGSFAQPHTNPTPGTSRSSDGTLPLPPEYKIPSAYVTNVHHHYHYHYNTPNASTPPIINNNIVRINNKNTSNGSDGCESGDDEGEH